MNFNIKKVLGILSYYILPAGLFLISYFTLDTGGMFGDFGNYAIYLLGAILFVKPLAVVLNNKYLWKIVSLRRELGVADFWFFFFHAAGLIYQYGLYDPAMWSSLSTFMYWGIAAGVGMLIVVLTSNNFAVKILKRNWKRVQSLTYFIFFAALTHVGILKDQLYLYLFIFLVFAVLKVIEFRKIKNITSV